MNNVSKLEPIYTPTTVMFKDGDNGESYIKYEITVYAEDAAYFESKLLDEAESIFYAQKQAVTPLRRMEA